MENKNKPAFSVALKENNNPYHPSAMGLTKREYFAAIALQGILSNHELLKGLRHDYDLIIKATLEISEMLLEELSSDN
jgi:hypothetical protein